jgi:hypothetical protein
MLTKIKLETLECLTVDDSNGDEPSLWTIFFKIDGSTIKQNGRTLMGEAELRFTSGSHNDLGRSENSVLSGTSIPIPSALGEWITELQPISIDLITQIVPVSGLIGSVVILLKEDAVTDNGVEAGHLTLDTFIRDQINTFISEIDLFEIKEQANQIKEPSENLAIAIGTVLDLRLKALEQSILDHVSDVVGGAASHPSTFPCRQREVTPTIV